MENCPLTWFPPAAFPGSFLPGKSVLQRRASTLNPQATCAAKRYDEEQKKCLSLLDSYEGFLQPAL
jgi:hypothetical protein